MSYSSMILLSQFNFDRHQWYYSKLDLLMQLFWVARLKGNTEFAHRKWTRAGEGYKVVITHLSSFPGLSAYFCEDHGTQLKQCRYQSGLSLLLCMLQWTSACCSLTGL